MENLNERIKGLTEKYSNDLNLLSIVRGMKSSRGKKAEDFTFYLRRLRNEYPEVFNLYMFFCQEELIEKEELPIVYVSEKVEISLQACYAFNPN